MLEATQAIERELGRTNKGSGAPRTLDIDILLYNDQILCEDDLIIPHPMMLDRLFVLEPLNQIAPHVKHPVVNEPIQNVFGSLKGY